MKKLFILIAGISVAGHAADFQVSGKNDLRMGIDSLKELEPSRYFQDWFDMNISRGDFVIDLGLESQIAPFPGSFSPTDSIGIAKRTFMYKKNGMTLKAGNFFTTLGNGITFRSYEDRDIGWNTNVDGAQFLFEGSKIEGQFFGGKMRDTKGKRYELIEGGSMRFMPGETVFPGITGMVSKKDGTTHYVGSLTTEFYFPVGSIKGEFAAADFGKSGAGFTPKAMITDWHNFLNNGRVAYLNSTIMAGTFTFFLEGKNYKKFNLENQSLALNTPPTAVRDHLVSLFSDQTPDGFKGGNEKGFLAELSGPLWGENMFTASYSNTRTEDLTDRLLFDELYGQTDLKFGDFSSMVAGGFQRDEAGKYVNGAIHGELPLGNASLKGEFAHQHRTLDRNFSPSRQYFFQTYELGVAWKQFVLSGIGAGTSDPQRRENDSDNLFTKGWFGGQFNWTFKEQHRLTVFAGTRKDGKICAGGVCVKKPELKGIELTITSSF